jgi:hypothetical protein
MKRILTARPALWLAAIVFFTLTAGPAAAQSGSRVPAGWIEFTDQKEGFVINFPTRPEEKRDKFVISKNGAALSRHYYSVTLGTEGNVGARYMVGAVTLPIAPPAQGQAVISREMFEKLMFKLKEGFEVSLNAGSDVSCYLDDPAEVISGAHKGREYRLRGGQGCPPASIRLFPTARRFFVVASIGAGGDEFLRSFKILNSGERLIIQ